MTLNLGGLLGHYRIGVLGCFYTIKENDHRKETKENDEKREHDCIPK